MRPLPHVAWPPLSSCIPCTKTALGTCQWARRLSLLHSPPCLGLGPRDAGPGGGCVVPARPSACPLQRWPNRFHSNWQSQTQNLGETKAGQEGLCFWAALGRLQALFCSLLHAGVEDILTSPRLPSRGSKVSGGREGGPREGERQRAHTPASWVLCWSLSVQGLAPARQRAGRVRLRRAHACLSSGRVPLPCPQEWSFPCRERRRC